MTHRLFTVFCASLAWWLGVPVLAQPTPRESMIEHVAEVAAPGIPGPLVLAGENAFPIVAGKQGKAQHAVIAGATAGQGRIVAFGHTGYLDAGVLKVADTGLLFDRCIRWAAGDRGGPTIGVLGDAKLAEALRARGFNAAEFSGLRPPDLAVFNAVCIPTHRLRDEDIKSLQDYIREGGGVLAAGLGWGWLQLNPSRAIREHPGNRLLMWAGLGFGDGMLDRTRGEGFGIAPSLPDTLHADAAMERLAAGDVHQGDESAQVAASISGAIRVIDPAHPVFARARELLAAATDRKLPQARKPVRAGDVRDRVLLALDLELEQRAQPDEIRPHAAASFFPGEVPADAPRLRREVATNPDRRGWQGTGLYAPPGEIVTITLPADAPKKGLRVRIGCHTDTLWHHDAWRRFPDIAREFQLTPGVNRVASAFGGLIYLETPARAPRLSAVIEGAVESPRFILGETTPEQWAALKNAPAPWGEIETAKIIVSVPSEALRALTDPTPVLEMWDKISDAHAILGTIPLVTPRPERFVADEQISAGYMHSGYPIMTHLDAVDEMTQVEKLRAGSWGLLHELGHNRQVGDWTFSGTGEVTCNLFALHAIDTVCTPPEGTRGHGGVDKPPSFEQYRANGAKFEHWKRDPFLALHMYVQLQKAFGWETFKKVFAEYRALPDDQRPRTDAQKMDQWMVRFSRACGHNLGPFFVAWGVPTSDEARASIAELPVWMPEGATPASGSEPGSGSDSSESGGR